MDGRRLRSTKRILVVDDEPTIREVISEALREAGYVVDSAANGADALREMRRQRPRAIVLDLMMPILDASGFHELMRLNPRYADIPIVVVTAAYAAAESAERIGASAYLTKPFELDELVATVAGVIGQADSLPLDLAPTQTETQPGLQANLTADG